MRHRLENHRGENIARPEPVHDARKRKNIAPAQRGENLLLRQRPGEPHAVIQIPLRDVLLQLRTPRPLADNVALKLQPTRPQCCCCCDQMMEPLELNQPAYRHNPRHAVRGTRRHLLEIRQVHPVEHPEHFPRRVRAQIAQLPRAPRRLVCHELSLTTNLPQQIVVAEIHHVILPVGGHAERKPADRLQEQRRVRRAVCKVHMKMREAARLEQIRKIQRIPRPHGRLVVGAVLPLVARDEVRRPAPLALRLLLAQLQDALRRRVMHRCLQLRVMAVAKRRVRRINAENPKLHPGALKCEHLRIDERLRDNRVSAEKVCDSHNALISGKFTPAASGKFRKLRSYSSAAGFFFRAALGFSGAEATRPSINRVTIFSAACPSAAVRNNRPSASIVIV